MAPELPHATQVTAAHATGVVGIGASAGGLEPLSRFLGATPPSSGLTYIIVQHLDPTQRTILPELLRRASAIPVQEAVESAPMVPNVAYVIPPNTELTLRRGCLHLELPDEAVGVRSLIDVLFTSLADELGSRAIGVVMSGMGSDGTAGLLAIQKCGGLTAVQDPASAQFDSMPASAMAALTPDVIAHAADLPGEILRKLQMRPPGDPSPAPGDPPPPPKSIGGILDLLAEHTRHDLRLYKPSTLLRRIERRMAAHRATRVEDYERILRDSPVERDLLLKEMLIGVTSFFRDAPVWAELHDTVLPGLLDRREPGSRLRAWVAGCSTGEEAYSLAMAFSEVVEARRPGESWPLQIFATDLSADAVSFARKGLYPHSIADSMDAQRIRRFFHAEGAGLRISAEIRNMVLFAEQDLIRDPPFTRIDMLFCRNLLIYFTASLQHRLIGLFHYAMRPGAVLVLGEAESISGLTTLYKPLHRKLRIFEANPNPAATRSVVFPTNRAQPQKPAHQEPTVPNPIAPPPSNLQALADHVLLQEFSPAAVLVNAAGDILYVSGRTGRYLEAAAGKANWNIHVMARPEIREQLAAGLRRAMEDRATVEAHGLRLDDAGGYLLDITIRPSGEGTALDGTVMIVFREVAPAAAGDSGAGKEVADPAHELELLRMRDEVRSLRQRMTASQEELQAANEELQSTNEELQSANEELTTSKEETQSMNEELQTVNAEMRSKLADLELAQNDMQNLLNSTEIATLFLDNDQNVRRFTERVTRIVHLRDSDIGRPLSDLATTLVYPTLCLDVSETLRTLVFRESQIRTTDDHWYSVRIMPYRTLANVIQGAVITFVDITVAKDLEGRLRKPGQTGVEST